MTQAYPILPPDEDPPAQVPLAGLASLVFVAPVPVLAAAPEPAPVSLPVSLPEVVPVAPRAVVPLPDGGSSSAELLRHVSLVEQDIPATRGWRAVLRTRPGKAELAERASQEMLRRTFSGPKTVMIANPKGGAGKTPTTLALGATLGQARGGYVVAWDNNETRGTLGLRARAPLAGPAGGTSVWELLADLERFEKNSASVGELARYLRPQETSFDVLASAENPAQMAHIGARKFARLHDVLSRFYRIVLVDTGNNVRAPNWEAACEAADVLVVVSNYEWDTGYSASWMLDHLCAVGREDLVSRAVTVLTSADQRADKATRDELVRHFTRTSAIVEIPYDPGLRGGGEIAFGALRDSTRRAWTDVAEAVCTQLGMTDEASEARRLQRRDERSDAGESPRVVDLGKRR